MIFFLRIISRILRKVFVKVILCLIIYIFVLCIEEEEKIRGFDFMVFVYLVRWSGLWVGIRRGIIVLFDIEVNFVVVLFIIFDLDLIVFFYGIYFKEFG